jgi:DNA-directed RNA polymerase specialized sigma24 family protein
MYDSVSQKRHDFGDGRSPQLEALLQISLGLTKNGRDAVRLLNESMSEATLFWAGTAVEDTWSTRLHEILTRRFFSSFQESAHPQATFRHTTTPQTLAKYQLLLAANPARQRNPAPAAASKGQLRYVKAITGLPMEFRPAMILSYIEGFSNTEIADLAGRQPHEIESLLYRGCRLVRDVSGFNKVIGYGAQSA